MHVSVRMTVFKQHIFSFRNVWRGNTYSLGKVAQVSQKLLATSVIPTRRRQSISVGSVVVVGGAAAIDVTKVSGIAGVRTPLPPVVRGVIACDPSF